MTVPHDRDEMGICRRCGNGITAPEIINGERPCRSETPPTRIVYSVQAWTDVDAIRDAWITGYGSYTHSRADAEAELRHVRRAYPHTSFRLAAAEISEWREVRP